MAQRRGLLDAGAADGAEVIAPMEIARLVLEYLKVLVWPVTVLVVLWRYRRELDTFLHRLVSESSEIEGFGIKAKLRSPTPEERLLEDEKEALALAEFRGDPEQLSFTPVAPSMSAKLPLLVQELVLRDLENRWGVSIRREPVLELANGRRLHFDGLADKPEQTVFIEVKLITDPRVGEIFLNATENVIAVLPFAKKPVILTVVLVTQGPEETFADALKFVRQHVLSAPVPTTVEHFRVEDLLAEPSDTASH